MRLVFLNQDQESRRFDGIRCVITTSDYGCRQLTFGDWKSDMSPIESKGLADVTDNRTGEKGRAIDNTPAKIE